MGIGLTKTSSERYNSFVMESTSVLPIPLLSRFTTPAGLVILFGFPGLFALPRDAFAAGGSLTVIAEEESTGEATITRFELWRAESPGKLMPVRKVVPAGIGVVLDQSVELSLPDAAYQFRMIRGPEYRIISGAFSLERTSLDEHRVQLPRMVNMLENGWTSGDCCLPASPHSLPMRMAAEDLHLAAVLGACRCETRSRPRSNEPPKNEPAWIREDVVH